MLKINRIRKDIQMETFLSNNEIINNLCYDEAGLTFTVSAWNLGPKVWPGVIRPR